MKCKELFSYSKDNYNKYCSNDDQKEKRKLLIGLILLLISGIFFYFEFNNNFNNNSKIITILSIILFIIGFVAIFLIMGSFLQLSTFSMMNTMFVQSIIYALDEDNTLYKITKRISDDVNAYNKGRGIDILTKSNVPLGKIAGTFIDLEHISNDNKKMENINKINFILDNPMADQNIQVIKFLNIYSVKNYNDRIEIICDILHMENNKLVEKDKISIYKCYNEIDKLISLVNSKINDNKKDLTEERKLEEWVFPNKNLVNSMFAFTAIGVFLFLINTLNGAPMWFSFIMASICLFISYKIGKNGKVIIFDNYKYKIAMTVNLALFVIYFVMMIIDFII